MTQLLNNCQMLRRGPLPPILTVLYLKRFRQFLLLGVVISFILTSSFVVSVGFESIAYQVYIIPPITNEKILPYTSSIKGVLSNNFFLFATPGEYEPASFVIKAKEELTNVRIICTDLKSIDINSNIAIIPKEMVDIRVVKVWYQAGIAINDVKNKVLTPELLLHDDSLIEIDHEKKINLIILES